MAKKKLSEAQFVSIYGNNDKPDDGVYYQDGDFVITNDRMKKHRSLFNPWYKDIYKGDKEKVLNQLAYEKTYEMIHNGESIPEFGDVKRYHSLTNKPFSQKQIEYVKNKYIIPKYGNMSLENLYDVMSINRERNMYNIKKKGIEALSKLLENGFLDNYMNGSLRNIALFGLGKLKDAGELRNWLSSENRFAGKTNHQVVLDTIEDTIDAISSNSENFAYNDVYLGLNEIIRLLGELKKKG